MTHLLQINLIASAFVLGTFVCCTLMGQDSQPADPAKAEPATTTLDDGFGGTAILVNPVTSKWKVGVQIKAGRSSAKNFLVTIPIPTNWPEQQITLLEESVPPEVRSVKHRQLNSGVEQLVILIPRIQARQLVELTMLYQVSTGQIVKPTNTAEFKIPSKVPREAREYIGVSPQITYRNAKLRAQVKELMSTGVSDWQKIEAIFDWVRDNIEFVSGEPDDSIHTFRSRKGCAEDLVGLFVAMCRAGKVPARMVWVEGHSYAEFMMLDEKDQPRWFPCQVAGLREFGSISEPRVILQKGDNIKVPEKENRQKFVAEFVKGSGKAKPQVRFIRDLLPAN